MMNMKRTDVLDKKQQKALQEYQEYKKLRTIVTKPIRAFNDTEAILKDLQGESFTTLQEEIERLKKARTKTIQKSKLKLDTKTSNPIVENSRDLGMVLYVANNDMMEGVVRPGEYALVLSKKILKLKQIKTPDDN